jgi:hypothetical protein
MKDLRFSFSNMDADNVNLTFTAACRYGAITSRW